MAGANSPPETTVPHADWFSEDVHASLRRRGFPRSVEPSSDGELKVMTGKRASYGVEFRARAVRGVTETGEPAAQVARDVGCARGRCRAG